MRITHSLLKGIHLLQLCVWGLGLLSTKNGFATSKQNGRRLLSVLVAYMTQECIPVECVPSATVAVCWGVSATGGLVSAFRGGGGVCFPGGGGLCFREGGCLPGGLYRSMHWGRHPAVDRMTDRCKTITFPQLRLRTVNMLK